MMVGQHRLQNVHLAYGAEERHRCVRRDCVSVAVQLLDEGGLLLQQIVEEFGESLFGQLFGEAFLQCQIDVEFAQFVVDGGTKKRPSMLVIAVERAALLVEGASAGFTQADATLLQVMSEDSGGCIRMGFACAN